MRGERRLKAYGDVVTDLNSKDQNKVVEAKAFELLKDVLSDIPSLLYYKPLIRGELRDDHEIDILWIQPFLGLLVIEVKAWDYEFLSKCRIENDFLCYGNKRFRNPRKEAFDFVRVILNNLKRENLRIPVRYALFYPNLTKKDFENLPEHIKTFIADNYVIFKGSKKEIREQFERVLKKAFSGFQRYVLEKELKEEEVNKLRRCLFPYLTIAHKDFFFYDKNVPILDFYQETLLYSVREGSYRILRGTVGSGKTVVLIAKGIYEKEKNPEKKVLFLTFTNALVNEIKAYIERLIKLRNLSLRAEDFEIKTFYTLITQLYKKYVGNPNGVSREELEKAVISLAERGELKEEDKYDVILCDEAQDFKKEFFTIIKGIKKDNSIIVFGIDETQRIYEDRDWKWKEVGFEARGRNTIILRRSYRIPTKLFHLALDFLKKDEVLAKDLKELQLENVYTIRKDEGTVNFFIGNEKKLVEKILKHLLGRGINPGDIFILSPTSSAVSEFKDIAINVFGKEHVHYFSHESDRNAKFVPEDKLVIMPYKSSKGLERSVVIVTGTHLLPFQSSTTVEKKRLDRRTLYVALTRAKTELFITAEREEGFAKDIKELYERLK